MSPEAVKDIRENWLPISLVATLVLTALGLGWQAQRVIARLERVEEAVHLNVTEPELQIYMLTLANENPGLNVPGFTKSPRPN